MFRLIGIGLSALCDADGADFAEPHRPPQRRGREAIDRLRERFGDEAVIKGLALDGDNEDE